MKTVSDPPSLRQKRGQEHKHHQQTQQQTAARKKSKLTAPFRPGKQKQRKRDHRRQRSETERRDKTQEAQEPPFPRHCGIGVNPVIHRKTDHDSAHPDHEKQRFTEQQAHHAQYDRRRQHRNQRNQKTAEIAAVKQNEQKREQDRRRPADNFHIIPQNGFVADRTAMSADQVIFRPGGKSAENGADGIQQSGGPGCIRYGYRTFNQHHRRRFIH